MIAFTIALHVSENGGPWTWTLLPARHGVRHPDHLGGPRLAAPRTASRLPEILTAVSKG
ncbi:hypothetical protein [Streptomyces agglomeratus]|uniref:hypothetical protein n=1 Tax=Streptomyces agglomeratus TaxID=285458 RepID=UPI000A93F88C